MRRFSPEYLDHTREGMWADDRAALADLDLASRTRVLDVGCGTGELTRILVDETPPNATVVGVDADPALLRVARSTVSCPFLAGDATRLPVPDDAVDLVVCQALLINLPDPAAAVREFARVSSDRIAAVEPNNADVTVESTIGSEARVEREARAAFLAGVETNVSLGEQVATFFGDAGVKVRSTGRYIHEKRTAPPYTDDELQAAARKASGAGIADHAAELQQVMTPAAYDDLRQRWREMGRAVIEAMQAGTYERIERVPFDVTVGQVSEP